MRKIDKDQRVKNYIFAFCISSLFIISFIERSGSDINLLYEKVDNNEYNIDKQVFNNSLQDSIIKDLETKVSVLIIINQALIEKQDNWDDTLNYLNLIQNEEDKN